MYGDNAYGTGEFQDRLDRAGIESKCKTQPPVAAGGRFAKDRFDIDLDADTVRCPAGNTAPIVRDSNGAGTAAFGTVCAGCPLREQCTTARAGRTISVGVHEAALVAARARQQQPDWVADYRATRPKVERKFGHLMRRKHGGRRARVRGTTKIAADFALLAAGGQPGTAGRTRGGVHQVRMGRRDRMSRHLGGETPSSGRRVASKRPLSRRTRGRRLLPSGSPNFSSIG